MRRKFRKSKGPVAREGCIGGWVRASSIDSRRGISADYTRQPSKKKRRERGIGIWRPRTSFVTLGIVSSAETFRVEETSSLLNNLNRVEEELVGLNLSWIIWIEEELVSFDMNEHSVLFYHGEFIIGVEELREDRYERIEFL